MPHIPVISEHPEWRVILFRAGTGVMLGSIAPSNLSFARYIREIGYINFDMNLSHPLVSRSFIEPYATDFVLMHKEHHILGGIITGVHVDTRDRVMSLAGKGFMHYLEKRFWPIDPVNPEIYAVIDEDSFTVITDILDRVLMEPHSLMMDYDFGLSGVDINYRIEPADTESIYEKMRDLAEQDPGFDFVAHVDIVDGMIHIQLMAESPRIERLSEFAFVKGKNLKDVDYDCTGIGATWVVGTGAGSSNKIVKIAEDVGAQETYRRLDHSVDFGDIPDPRIVQRQTNAERNRMVNTHREDFSAIYIPEPNIDLWVEVELGDVCTVITETEYEAINEQFRVVGYEVQPSEQGDEEVTVIFEDAEV